MFTLNLLKESIWFAGVEDFIAVHYCYKIFGIAQINDVVRISRKHVNCLHLIATHFPFQHLALRVVQVSLLDEAMTFHHDELLELRIVPVLTLSNTRLTDINGHLPCIKRMHQFSETSTFIFSAKEVFSYGR